MFKPFNYYLLLEFVCVDMSIHIHLEISDYRGGFYCTMYIWILVLITTDFLQTNFNFFKLKVAGKKWATAGGVEGCSHRENFMRI